MPFERFVPSRKGRGKPANPIRNLEVGEIAYFPLTHRDLYSTVYYEKKKHPGKEFEWQECKNGGTVIRRCQ